MYENNVRGIILTFAEYNVSRRYTTVKRQTNTKLRTIIPLNFLSDCHMIKLKA